MNSNGPSFPNSDSLSAQRTIIVSQEIAALELLPTSSGAHAGCLTPVPQGTRLEVCGRGFTERTIQVRWEGRLGFIFLQDVEPVLWAQPSRAVNASALITA